METKNDFSGNSETKNVEIDLNRFISILDENRRLSEANIKYRVNRLYQFYDHLLHISQVIDEYRIFPRIFISVYLYLLYESSIWYMTLAEPSTTQAGYISTVIGAGAAWFGLYAATRGDGNRKKPERG